MAEEESSKSGSESGVSRGMVGKSSGRKKKTLESEGEAGTDEGTQTTTTTTEESGGGGGRFRVVPVTTPRTTTTTTTPGTMTPGTTTPVGGVAVVRVDSVEAGTERTQEETAKKGLLDRLFPREGAAGMPFIGAYMRAEPEKAETEKGSGRRKKLGLMIGVYLPSIQNVFGVVMFLRLCWMVGMMGVGQAFLMVFLCCLTTFLTTLSVSAIATNGVVESGGTYFMISRSLGPHLGVACGILFYLANTIAVAMYTVGGMEIFLNYMAPRAYLWGWDGTENGLVGIRSEIKDFASVYNNHVRLYGTILLLFTFAVISLGVRVVQLFAPISLAGVLIAIAAIYAGAIEKSVAPENRPKVCLTTPDNYLLASKHCQEGCRNGGFSSLVQRNENRATLGCNTTKCVDGITGLNGETLSANSFSKYTNSVHSSYRWRSSKGGGEEKKSGQSTVGEANGKEAGLVMNHEVTLTTFFVIMGIYFPSVTGILTGSNMSGDLEDPQKSIPAGTLAAQLTTSFVYLSFVVIFGACVEPGVLLDKNGDSLNNRMVIGELAWPSHWIVVVGCFLSTFGAGLQSLCSAPRLLASIAKDNIIPCLAPFARTNCWNEPHIALYFTTTISFLCLMIGILDLVAPLVAMFFLQLYAFVNLACAVMTLMGSPGWRPRYKGYHWSLSLFGFFLSYFIMFSTFWHFAMITVVVGLVMACLVGWKGRQMEWGDGTQGLALSLSQFFLYKLEGRVPHPKNWRPQLLILNHATDSAALRPSLAFIQQLKAGRGLVMVANLVETKVHDDTAAEESATLLSQEIRSEMDQHDIHGFVENVFYGAGRLGPSVSVLIQTAGISGLKPNTIFAPWPSNWANLAGAEERWTFLDRIHRASRLHHCLVTVKGLDVWPGERERKTGTMDVWWIIKDGGLLLLIAHLLKKNDVWYHTRLRLFIATDEAASAAGAAETDVDRGVRESVEALLYQLRIQGEVTVVGMGQEADAYRRGLGEEGKKREAVLAAMDTVEVAEVKTKDPQLVVEEGRKRAELFSGRETNSFLESHPLTHFTFSKTQTFSKTETGGMVPDDASYLESVDDRKLRTKSVEEQLSGFSRDTCKSARALNHRIRHFSTDADVIILNLPQPPRNQAGMQNYMLYMEIMMNKLPRVVLIRGSGKEVITKYQ